MSDHPHDVPPRGGRRPAPSARELRSIPLPNDEQRHLGGPAPKIRLPDRPAPAEAGVPDPAPGPGAPPPPLPSRPEGQPTGAQTPPTAPGRVPAPLGQPSAAGEEETVFDSLGALDGGPEGPAGSDSPFAAADAFGDGSAAGPDPDDLGALPGLEERGDPRPVFDPSPTGTGLSPRHQLEAWLATMVERQASDLILRAGGRPSCRVDGRISFLPGRVPNSGPLLEVLDGIVGEDRMAAWRETGSVDIALELDGLGRFRLNAYRQMGSPALVLRRIANRVPPLDSLNLPSAPLKKLVTRTRGLVLVTGVAGSGKSTTLAAMIQYLNTEEERHVITLEDPVETVFTEEKCVISQREVGTDCKTFHEGLRHSLRQSPDVILIGEMRDAETVAAALDATETGHMVLSTLHTVNAPQTLDRILGFFSAEQHKQVAVRLGENLRAVLSMRLLPKRTGEGMVPACELMVSTPQVRELLSEGRTGEISRVIEQGVEPGQISFNQSLRRLVERGLIELDTALDASDRPDELLMALRGISGGDSRRRRAQGLGDGRLRRADG